MGFKRQEGHSPEWPSFNFDAPGLSGSIER
jgi:hypothetical protein